MPAFCPVPLTLSSCVVSGGEVLREPKSREFLSSSESESEDERVRARSSVLVKKTSKRSRSASVSGVKMSEKSRLEGTAQGGSVDEGREARSSASVTKTSRKSFGEGQFDNCLFGILLIILAIGGTDSVGSRSYVLAMDKKEGVPIAPVEPVSRYASRVLKEKGVYNLYSKFLGHKFDAKLRTKGLISLSRSIMCGSHKSWRHDLFLLDKSCREEFGSSRSSTRLDREAGLSHFSSGFYDKLVKIIFEKHFESNMVTSDCRLRGLGKAFQHVYCEAVLFPELVIEAYTDVLVSQYLAKVVFFKLTSVDQDKCLEANFRSVMDSCKT